MVAAFGGGSFMRQLDIFRFWLPLFASWLLMLAEGPLVSAAVNRLPDEVVMLAAFGIVVSLAVLIESPVINLLATATALVHDRASYLQVRRFTVHWMVLLTIVQALVAFTPLFDFLVLRMMAVPEEVARWVRPGMQIMVPWSGAIAWRRFLQGVLIHFNRTRLVARGTAVRLTAVVAAAVVFLAWGRLPGVYLGSIALTLAVLAEALYVTLVARPIVRSLSGALPAPTESRSDASAPLSYRGLLDFHLPLAGTAVLTLLTQPLVAFCLARLDQPTLTLAAWPVILFLTLIMRAGAMALPEVIIALDKTAADHAPLRRFSFSLAGGGLLAMGMLALTPLADLYLIDFQNTTPEIAVLARYGLLLFVPLPAIVTLISWLRGSLIGRRRTAAVNAGMALRLVVFIAVLALGLHFAWAGITTAAWAFNLSVVTELAYLSWKVEGSGSTRCPSS